MQSAKCCMSINTENWVKVRNAATLNYVCPLYYYPIILHTSKTKNIQSLFYGKAESYELVMNGVKSFRQQRLQLQSCKDDRTNQPL